MSFLAINRSRARGVVPAPIKKVKFPIIGKVKDVDGAEWYVRDIRTTKHGFDLLFGSPVSRVNGFVGLPRLIATHPLKDFWEVNRLRRDATIYDLPAGRTTLKRVRQRLGFHVGNDTAKFWNSHIVDLRTLSAPKIAAKHNINLCVVRGARYRVLGKTMRERGWWREPRVVNILLSRLTLREMGKKLGIGITHARRLRERARQECMPDNHQVAA
jgi:hypothetical protein